MTTHPNINLDLIPSFNGDSSQCEFFFNHLQNIVTLYRLDLPTIKSILGVKLTGPALVFYIESPDNSSAEDFASLRNVFFNFFTTPKDREAMKQSFNRMTMMENENVKNYAHRLRCAADPFYKECHDPHATPVLDSLVKSKFISGLAENIRQQVINKKPATFQEAVQIAEQQQQQLSEKERVNNILLDPVKLTQTPSTLVKTIEALSEKVEALTNTTKSNPRQRDGPRTGEMQRMCMFCGGYGHLMIDCRKYRQDPRTSVRYHRPSQLPYSRRNEGMYRPPRPNNSNPPNQRPYNSNPPNQRRRRPNPPNQQHLN